MDIVGYEELGRRGQRGPYGTTPHSRTDGQITYGATGDQAVQQYINNPACRRWRAVAITAGLFLLFFIYSTFQVLHTAERIRQMQQIEQLE